MFAKLFERIVFNQVNEFIQNEEILNGTQFGFQIHKSSTDAVSHLIETLQENYDNLKISVAVFIGLAKSFNSISHEIFLKKMKLTVFQKVQLIYLLHFLKTDSNVLR